MIDVKADTFVVALWFVDLRRLLPAPGGDWAAFLYRNGEAGLWVCDYRFRYYKSLQAFDSGDVSHRYRAEHPSAEKLERVIDEELTRSFRDAGAEVVKVEVRARGPEPFFAAVKSLPFAHVKEVG